MTWVPSCECALNERVRGEETGPSKNSKRPYRQYYCAVCGGVFTDPDQRDEMEKALRTLFPKREGRG